MEQHRAVDGGSLTRMQKHDSRINNGPHLSEGSWSDMTGDARKKETDEIVTTDRSVPLSAKCASPSSSPAYHEMARTRSVEKFVFEVDKSKPAAVGCAHPVSWGGYFTIMLNDIPLLLHIVCA